VDFSEPEAASVKIEAVCFDMDGTLITNPDSVRYLCTLNGRAHELAELEEIESNGSLSWIDADYRKAKLMRGLHVAEVGAQFKHSIELIRNIDKVSAYLRKRETRSVLITAGPIQVADVLGRQFAFDGVYGSLYEVKSGRFTGRITSHLGSSGKLDCLEEFCFRHGIDLEHAVAIGNSESDLGLFRRCRRSIAINYTDILEGQASEHIITDDLSDVIPILESWFVQ
jgi:phosphoserine phosphatase